MMTCKKPPTSFNYSSNHQLLYLSHFFFNSLPLLESELPPKPPKLLIDLVKKSIKVKSGIHSRKRISYLPEKSEEISSIVS